MSASLRVWLVDDDASIRWVLERALRNDGMAPRAFDAAEPALAALRRHGVSALRVGRVVAKRSPLIFVH